MAPDNRPRDPRPSIRLLDYLTFPIAKPSHNALRKTRSTQDSAIQNEYTAPGQCIRAQRWRDFTYPVLRIALRDLLEYRPHDQALYNPGDAGDSNTSAVAPFLQRLDFPVSALLNRVGRALHCTASQMQWHGEPRFEFEYLAPDPTATAATYTTPGGRRRSVVAADREWHFHVHQRRRLVVGLVKSAVDEFPLPGLGIQSGAGAHEGVQKTLRQARAACQAGGADYGFVLTPEGAAVLCFRGTDPGDEEEAGADVCLAVVPWTRAGAGDNVNQLPLTMALWALCVVAEVDDRRVVREGQQSPLPFPPPLNVWKLDAGGPGTQMYRHAWLRQKTKGLPPGAVVQRSLVNRVGAEVSEDVEKSQDTDTSGKAEEAETRGKAEEADTSGKAEGTASHVDKRSSKGRGKRKKKAVVNPVFVANAALEPWSSRLRPRKRRPNYRL